MTSRSKSTLFLIEQLIVIAVFAICAAACISILTAAFFYTNDSSAASNAIVKAESTAEVFKATGGDLSIVSDVLSGVARSVTDAADGDTVIIRSDTETFGDVVSLSVFYDSKWQACGIIDASYILSIRVDFPKQVQAGYSLVTGDMTVSRVTGEVLVSLPVSARMSGGELDG